MRAAVAWRVVLFAGALGLAACTSQEPLLTEYGEPDPVPAGPRRGEILYLRDCAWCHGERGEGTRRGPDLDGELDGPAYTHFMLSTGRMPIASQFESTLGREPIYTDEEIADIVEHVAAFGGTGPAIPEPDPEEGDLGEGAVLYFENCAACHSTTGVGSALTSGRIAPSLDRSTPVEVVEAMLVGPGCEARTLTCGEGAGAMPIFDFSEDEMNSIVAYVEYLQDPKTPGGWAIGKVGPVTEGAVGLIVGFGLMLLITRWIGTAVKKE